MLRPLPLLIIGILGLGTATFIPQVNATSGTLTISSKAIPKQAIPEIAYERFTLPNGLTVIVHEDHKAPVIAVNVWYHIGSADEPAGKTGLAHLFEHLMFSGSENHKASYFEPFEKVGVTGINGTTWFDRTNYMQTVPSTALDMALWMESDRMGHLLGAIGQKELDTQRGVVKNEKREMENVPYGHVMQNILSNLFPANHPYHHDTIGSMEDLEAASLADVKKLVPITLWCRQCDLGVSRRHHAGRGTHQSGKVFRRYLRWAASGTPAPLDHPAASTEARCTI